MGASSRSFPHHSPNGSNPRELERQKPQRAWQQRDNHKNAGVILASLSFGLGELSFLSLTHYYGPFALAAWAEQEC